MTVDVLFAIDELRKDLERYPGSEFVGVSADQLRILIAHIASGGPGSIGRAPQNAQRGESSAASSGEVEGSNPSGRSILDRFAEFAWTEVKSSLADLEKAGLLNADRNDELQFALAFLRDCVRKFKKSDLGAADRESGQGERGTVGGRDAAAETVIDPPVAAGAANAPTRDSAGQRREVVNFLLRFCGNCQTVQAADSTHFKCSVCAASLDEGTTIKIEAREVSRAS